MAWLYLVQLHIFWKFVHAIPWKWSTKGLLEAKNFWKFRILGCFSKGKTEGCNLKVWNVFDQFGITIHCPDAYFLEVGACVSLKVVTKRSIKDKKTSKIWNFMLIFSSKKGGVRHKILKCLWSIWHYYILFSDIFSVSRCTRFIGSSHQRIF